MRDVPEQRGGVMEFLFEQLRGAVGDIRSKLIEEGWFGRRSGAPDQRHSLGWTRGDEGDALSRVPAEFFVPRQPFEEAWAPRGPGEAGPERDQVHDLDR